MRKSRARPLLALLFWCWAFTSSAQPLPATTPQKVGLAPERLTRIGRVIEEDIGKGTIPGAVVLVARRGKVAYFESFGFLDRTKGVRMPKDAIFRIYSMTKPFTSAAALMLMEEGRLQLTDPVSKWVPEIKSMRVAVPKADPITAQVSYEIVPTEREMTVHDLLRHTSGLVYADLTTNGTVKDSYAAAGLGDDDTEMKLTPADWTAKLSTVLLAHQPGDAWEYGVSTDLLGRVIEAVTGKRLGDFLAERIFAPLAMADTAFFVPREKLARLAQPLATDPKTGKPIALIDVAHVPGNDMGGNGGVSTAGDYLRFCQMLLDGGRLGAVRLLSRTSVALMTSDHMGPRPAFPFGPGGLLGPGLQGYGFGLGFAVRLAPGIAGIPGSTGEYWWAGYAGTLFWIDPVEQIVAVYLTQARPIPSRRMIKQIITQAIAD
jgi:CubicO group peptidase (beta-lactamase class C family)